MLLYQADTGQPVHQVQYGHQASKGKAAFLCDATPTYLCGRVFHGAPGEATCPECARVFAEQVALAEDMLAEILLEEGR